MTQNITQRSKYNTQSYTNNEGYITHNEYNVRRKVKLSLQQSVEDYGVVRFRRSQHCPDNQLLDDG
jgi:hypothetical protein